VGCRQQHCGTCNVDEAEKIALSAIKLSHTAVGRLVAGTQCPLEAAVVSNIVRNAPDFDIVREE